MQHIKNIGIILSLCFLSILPSISQQSSVNYSAPQQLPLIIPTIYGDLEVDDPLAIELIKSPIMQRLKKINQYGVNEFVIKKKYHYTRFDHCLGVYYLLKKHGASRLEQIAGLLHDASHTVFSHTTDHLFKGGMDKGAYQDDIHGEFLKTYGADKILAKYGVSVEDVLPDKPAYTMLERDAPHLCADRIEYNIHAGDLEGFLTPAEIQEIDNAVHFDPERGLWYFDNVHTAEKFAKISLDQTVNTWGSAPNILLARWVSQAIKILWDKKELTKEDIHFKMSDEQMWQKLVASKDPEVMHLIAKSQRVADNFCYGEKGKCQDVLKSKFRGVNPLVRIGDKLVPLTEMSPHYRHEFNKTKNVMADGWAINFVTPEG